MVFKDENDTIRTPLEPSNVRKGRFLWKQKSEQLSYVQMLKNRIAQGFYTSDRVVTAVVDDLAPILGETGDPHPASGSAWESFATLVISVIVPACRLFGDIGTTIT